MVGPQKKEKVPPSPPRGSPSEPMTPTQPTLWSSAAASSAAGLKKNKAKSNSQKLPTLVELAGTPPPGGVTQKVSEAMVGVWGVWGVVGGPQPQPVRWGQSPIVSVPGGRQAPPSPLSSSPPAGRSAGGGDFELRPPSPLPLELWLQVAAFLPVPALPAFLLSGAVRGGVAVHMQRQDKKTDMFNFVRVLARACVHSMCGGLSILYVLMFAQQSHPHCFMCTYTIFSAGLNGWLLPID